MILVYKVHTHGRPPFTLPATPPVTQIFSHSPTQTLSEVKMPNPSQPGYMANCSTWHALFAILIHMTSKIAPREFFGPQTIPAASATNIMYDKNRYQKVPGEGMRFSLPSSTYLPKTRITTYLSLIWFRPGNKHCFSFHDLLQQHFQLSWSLRHHYRFTFRTSTYCSRPRSCWHQ